MEGVGEMRVTVDSTQCQCCRLSCWSRLHWEMATPATLQAPLAAHSDTRETVRTADITRGRPSHPAHLTLRPLTLRPQSSNSDHTHRNDIVSLRETLLTTYRLKDLRPDLNYYKTYTYDKARRGQGPPSPSLLSSFFIAPPSVEEHHTITGSNFVTTTTLNHHRLQWWKVRQSHPPFLLIGYSSYISPTLKNKISLIYHYWRLPLATFSLLFVKCQVPGPSWDTRFILLRESIRWHLQWLWPLRWCECSVEYSCRRWRSMLAVNRGRHIAHLRLGAGSAFYSYRLQDGALAFHFFWPDIGILFWFTFDNKKEIYDPFNYLVTTHKTHRLYPARLKRLEKTSTRSLIIIN